MSVSSCHSRRHSHQNINYTCISSRALRLLELIHFITDIFPSSGTLKASNVSSVNRSKLQYASVTWDNLTLTDSNKLENTLKKLVNLSCSRFDQFSFCRNYGLILERLKFKTLYSRWQHLGGLFIFNIFKAKIDCHSIINTFSLRVRRKVVRDFSTFTVSKSVRPGVSTLLIAYVTSAVSLCETFPLHNSG
jgi:hypothetical protein